MRHLAATLALLALSCGGAFAPAPLAANALPINLVLRTYDVPGNAAPQVRGVLKDLLWFGSDGKDSQKFVGRAEVGVDGRLVVLAPEAVQDGVKALLAQIATRPPKPAPLIEVEYWLVLGKAGQKGTVTASLNEVKAALAEIEKADGPQEFTLSEKLSAHSISGEMAVVSGFHSEARQTATAVEDGIRADIHIERFGQRFDTRMKFSPGQLVVLGSSGADERTNDGPGQAIYYIVRAATHDGPSR